MRNDKIKSILCRLAHYGAGTINSLIYGQDTDTTYEYLCRENEGGTHCEDRHVYDRDGQRHRTQAYVRNDAGICAEINNLVRAGILKKFLPEGINWDYYRVTWFYAIEDDYARAFNSNSIPYNEINSYVHSYCEKKSRGSGIRSSASRLQICLANIAVNHFGYHTETLKELMEEGKHADPGIFERTTKNGEPLARLLDNSESYFESSNILNLNSEAKVRLFREFINNKDEVLKRYREKCSHESMIYEMERKNIMKFYKEHKDALIEFVKRNTELESMTSVQ